MIGKFIDNDNHERQRTNSALSNLMDAFPISKKKKTPDKLYRPDKDRKPIQAFPYNVLGTQTPTHS